VAIAISTVAETCRTAKRAARMLAGVDSRVKDAALEAPARSGRSSRWPTQSVS